MSKAVPQPESVTGTAPSASSKQTVKDMFVNGIVGIGELADSLGASLGFSRKRLADENTEKESLRRKEEFLQIEKKDIRQVNSKGLGRL